MMWYYPVSFLVLLDAAAIARDRQKKDNHNMSKSNEIVGVLNHLAWN